MTEPQFTAAPDSDGEGGPNRRLLVGGGVGALVLAALGGYLLLSGGSSDSTAITIPHHITPTVAASAGATASPSSESVLQNFHGDVDSRDPFALPPALTAAAAPAAAAAAAPAAPASAVPSPGTVTLPTTVTAGGTTVSVPPGTTANPTTVTVIPQADEFLQLLAVHHNTTTNVWTVDVRSATGVVKGVKPGTMNVAGTLFYFDGEDETSGSPTFVFELGESKGGNLVPDKRETATHVHADKSTLVLHDGNVDGGIYSE